MADEIDFSKVDAAFQQLAGDGKDALDDLSSALDGVLSAAGSDLNAAEQHYLLVHLVNQRDAGPTTDDELFSTQEVTKVSNFRILTAVPPGAERLLLRGAGT